MMPGCPDHGVTATGPCVRCGRFRCDACDPARTGRCAECVQRDDAAPAELGRTGWILWGRLVVAVALHGLFMMTMVFASTAQDRAENLRIALEEGAATVLAIVALVALATPWRRGRGVLMWQPIAGLVIGGLLEAELVRIHAQPGGISFFAFDLAAGAVVAPAVMVGARSATLRAWFARG